MKYLRLFESNSVIYDVKDICLELEDIGLQIDFNLTNRFGPEQARTPGGKSCIISISKDDMEYFDNDEFLEVREVVERLKGYLGSRVINVVAEADIEGDNGLESSEGFWMGHSIEDTDLKNVYSVKIEFMV